VFVRSGVVVRRTKAFWEQEKPSCTSRVCCETNGQTPIDTLDTRTSAPVTESDAQLASSPPLAVSSDTWRVAQPSDAEQSSDSELGARPSLLDGRVMISPGSVPAPHLSPKNARPTPPEPLTPATLTVLHQMTQHASTSHNVFLPPGDMTAAQLAALSPRRVRSLINQWERRSSGCALDEAFGCETG